MNEKPLDIPLFNESLRAIGKNVATQDNRITSHPIFVVEKYVRDFGYDAEFSDGYVWVDYANDHYEADEDEHANLDKLWQEREEIPSGWERVSYRERWEFVTCCFTEQGCKDYLRVNGHNVGRSRIYVHSGYRNHEWQALRKALLNGVAIPDGETERAQAALSELLYRNPQRNDSHAYGLELAAWGLGIKPERPLATDYDQGVIPADSIDEFVESFSELYEEDES